MLAEITITPVGEPRHRDPSRVTCELGVAGKPHVRLHLKWANPCEPEQSKAGVFA